MTAADGTTTGSALTGTSSRRPRKEGRVREVLTNERLILGGIGVVVFLFIWEFASVNGMINARWFPAPTLIAQAGLVELQTEAFYNSLAKSLNAFFWGFSLAVITGIPLGLATGWFKRLNYALDPWINFFNALPRVALLPILVIIFGVLGPEATIAVVFLGAFTDPSARRATERCRRRALPTKRHRSGHPRCH